MKINFKKAILECHFHFRRITFISAAIVLLCCIPGHAQQELTNLLDSAIQVRIGDLNESSRIAEYVFQQASFANNDTLASDALMLLGWNAQTTGDYKLSNTYFQKIIDSLASGYNTMKLGMTYSGIGMNYSAMGDYQAAMFFVLKYDSLFENIPLTYNHIQPKLQLGELYEQMQNISKAESYYQQAYNLSSTDGNHFHKVMALYYLLDFNLVKQGKSGFGKELQEYLSLVEKRNPDRTLHWGHAQMLFMGMTPVEKVSFLEKTRRELKSSEWHVSRYFSTSELINAYRDQGRYADALKLALEDLAFFQTQQNTTWILNLHFTLSDLYEKLGRPDEALKHLRAYSALRNSLYALDVAQYVDSLEVVHQSAQKEAQLARQESLLLQQSQQKRTLLLALGAVIFFGFFTALFFWNRNRLNAQLMMQNSELQTQKILQLEQEKKLLAMSSMIGGQEAERKRIAQDLHDGLGGLLSSVKAQLNLIQHQVVQLESIDLYRKANTLIDDASAELRRIAYNMMPSSLSRLGLEEALEDLSASLQTDHGLDVNLQIFGLNDRLDETTEIMIYRIIQELCNNVVKHAQASRLMIQINKIQDELILVIEDDGIGIDMDKMKHSNGIGMKSIESRVKFLNGSLDISGNAGQGTCVTINFRNG